MELAGRVAFVTGATGGIGRAICCALAEAGADIGVCYHSKPDAAALLVADLERKGRRAVAVKADVSRKAEVVAAIEAVRRRLGPIDILVNNAGMTMGGRLEEIAEADWDRCLAVNLKSVFLCTQAVIPEMKERRQGVIINLTSVAAKVGGINAAACYSVSKAGVSCLTIQAAKELLAYNVNVNAVAPGLIDTPMLDVYGQEKKEASIKGVVRGPGRPSDVADAVVFLASPRARYITGEILDVNGGIFMD
ncbi:MAG: SDR family NAD(P)-dependent oxidoreductase [Bacillota bacterium]|nr:SDR family NAD(P)-dependent oxidoreductase [Bacillota bacterium]